MADPSHEARHEMYFWGAAITCACGWHSDVYGGSFGKHRATEQWIAHLDESGVAHAFV